MKFRFFSHTEPSRQGSRKTANARQVRLSVEALEDRTVLSNLVMNGSFETPLVSSFPGTGNSYATIQAPANLGGWILDQNNVDLATGPYQAADGAQLLFLSGTNAGSVYQDLATVPGENYHLRFAMAGDPSQPGWPLIKHMEVLWGNTVVATPTFDITGKTQANMGWEYHDYTVTATADTTSLRFSSLDFDAAGPAVDDVIVEPVQTDIDMQSAQLLNGNTVQFTYQTTGNPGPFQVGLYRSADGITYDVNNPLDVQTVTPSPTNPQAPGTFTLPSPWTPDPTKPYLVVVADPNDAITETDPNNNMASLRLPDLAVTQFAWNISGSTGSVDGVNIQYAVSGAELPQSTSITLFWANGDLILQPAYVFAASTAVGNYTQPVPLADLSPALAGATRLILAADPPTDTLPQGNILESNEGNNVSNVPLYALQQRSITFDPAIADRLDRLASGYYGATGKVLVITSGLRSPQEQAKAIADLISSRLAQGDNIHQALAHVRRIYHDGQNINLVLRNYDITKTPNENVQAMATVISNLLDAWNQQGRPGRPPLSYHLAGWAVDISITGMTTQDQQTLTWIARGLGLIVLTDEGGDPHIHISFPPT